ncbi:hypothetical protein C0Q70_09403 [Pomacea canaliculata]|uniref:Transmembrane protein 19 n=1 Tax=Pomacea canaliculata TaxID=400727 RepID=A0A2T7P9Q8_POMCA|nr:hypothetical protein C0Q70_09403 [Pomacea canaliculata]
MILVGAIAVLILVTSVLWIGAWLYGTISEDFKAPEPWRWFVACIAPMMIAVYGLKKRNLCTSGAVAGVIIGFLLTLSNLCFFAALLSFFFIGSRATKFKSHLKRKLEIDFKEGGQRNWIQVVCNGGVAAWLAIIYMIEVGCTELPINFKRHYTSSWLAMAVLGSLSCCCGDTLASELGTVIGESSPRLITNFKIVPKGTNGGISAAGTIASGIGGLLVGAAYYAVLLATLQDLPLVENPPQWPLLLVATLSGILGSMIDSLLGATVQYSGMSI